LRTLRRAVLGASVRKAEQDRSSRADEQAGAARESNSADVVTVVSSEGGYRLSGNAASVVEEIEPRTELRRFLQSWDPHRRVLAFGFGDGDRGVTVASNREVVDASTGIVRSRFTRTTYDRFREGRAVDTAALLNRVSGVFSEYIHFADQSLLVLLPLWTLGTYVYSMFTHFGYLHLYSDQKRSGKTQTLVILQHLVFDATVPLNAPTPPSMRDEAARGGTVLFDTLERWKSKDSYGAAMEMLDGGFRNGGTVSKKVQSEDGNWRTAYYPIYAPYALAGISRDSLSDTAIDRSFPIEMQRKPTRVRRRRYHFRRCEADCAPIREDCYVWALQHAAQLWAVYESEALDEQMYRIGLTDRAADIWRPLFAIASLANWDAEKMSELEKWAQKTGGDPEIAADFEHWQIAATIANHVTDNFGGNAALMTTQVVELLRPHGIVVGEHELHDLLELWGFEHKQTRVAGRESRRAWRLTTSALCEVVRRLGLGSQLPPE
jgi:hypothetical protein